MHFKIAKSAQSYFNNIMNLEGSHAAEDKNKFIQFDVYYCCALIGMAAGQIDEDTSELKDLVERYPVQYRDCKAQIAGLLVASEARRLGIDTQSPKLEQIMLQYLSNNDTLLSEDGIKTLNAYALKGYRLITDYPLFDKPTSREEFLDAFNVAMQFYEKKDSYLEKKNMYLFRQDHNHPSFVVYVEAVNEVYNRYFNRGGGYSVQSIF